MAALDLQIQNITMAKGAKVYWEMTQFDVKLVAWAYLWSSPRAPGEFETTGAAGTSGGPRERRI